MARYIRDYTFTFKDDKEDSSIEIPYPFTLEFDVDKRFVDAQNNARIRIYNLSEETRRRIRKDELETGDIFKHITLQAGYGDQKKATIFRGTVRHAFSIKSRTDYITEITADDGGQAFLNGITNDIFPANTDVSQILEQLAKGKLPGVVKGAIGNFPGTLARGNTYVGYTTDILSMLTGGGFFIDNEKAYCLGDDEVIRGELAVISSDSGLLGTPVIRGGYLTLEMLFEPRLLIGQIVEVQSSTFSDINGYYKVISMHHRGTISEGVCGSATTMLGLDNGKKGLFREVPTDD